MTANKALIVVTPGSAGPFPMRPILGSGDAAQRGRRMRADAKCPAMTPSSQPTTNAIACSDLQLYSSGSSGRVVEFGSNLIRRFRVHTSPPWLTRLAHSFNAISQYSQGAYICGPRSYIVPGSGIAVPSQSLPYRLDSAPRRYASQAVRFRFRHRLIAM